MFAVAVMYLLILFAFSLLTEFIGYGLARLLLPLLSSGGVFVQPFKSTEMMGFNLLGCRRDSQGRVEISKDAVGFTSFAVSLFLLVISASLIHAFSDVVDRHEVSVMNVLVVFALYFLLPEFIGYGVARVLLSVLSRGRIVVQPLASIETIGFNRFGYRRDGQGRAEVGSDVAIFLGFATFLILLITSGLLIRAFS